MADQQSLQPLRGTTAASTPAWTAALVVRNLLAFAANMLQVYGVLYWQWDTFQILMLYWMETAVIGFWALMRLAVLPAGTLGEMTVNGRVVQATNKLLLQLFVPFIVISLAGHLLILWVIFSGAWGLVVHGPVSFAAVFIVASGAWAPLLLTLLAGAVGFYQSPKRPTALGRFLCRLSGRRRTEDAVAAVRADGVGPAVGGALGRIVLMQVAIILGGMLARTYGSIAPWLILTALKTLADFERPAKLDAPTRGAVLASGRDSISA
jgi:hypothetical protein